MKSSFSLVEILISVVLISLIGTVLIQTHNNSLDIFDREDEGKDESIYAISFPTLEEYNELQNKNVRLEDYYNISDDDVRKFFKEKNNKPIKGRLPTDWARRKEIVWNRDDKKCLRCGRKIQSSESQLALIKKVDFGGEYNFENLITLCFDCNKILNSEDLSKTMKYLEIRDNLIQKILIPGQT
jgi:DNA-directed RNA polymerase subunit RPC12/RpoP